jgi:hypothetical protein
MAMRPNNTVAGIIHMAGSASTKLYALTRGVAEAGAFIKGKATHASRTSAPSQLPS